MNDDRIVPTPAPADLPTFTIRSDGEEISAEYHVVSITVTKAVNKIPYTKIIFLDGDVAEEDFKLSNTEYFIPGKEIEILAGYHSNESTIFKGIITAHSIKARKNKSSLLIIECKDKAFKMTLDRKSEYYYDSTDSDIMGEIIDSYGLDKEVETTDIQHKEMVKYSSTDWDFIVSRAEANSKIIFVDDGKITIKAPDTSSGAALSLIYGSTMMEFEAEIDARNQLSSVKSSSWNYTNQEIIEEESAEPGITNPGNIEASDLSNVNEIDSYPQRHTGKVIDKELKSWSNGKLLKSRLSKIIGRVKCQGYAEIKPGNMLELNGVGERFNGNTFVSAVRQQLDLKNWETDIQFGLTPKWFTDIEEINGPPAAGLLPAVNGLQIGIVTQLESDPDGEDRVLVKMPIVNPNENGIWARIAALDAGENRGSFFRPEIGDEVVLGFLNDDPRDPVMLGMFNSSAKPAPLTASDDNPEKGFVTRSEMKLIFNDEKKIITVETPNGNTIIFSDDEGSIKIQDENKNVIEMTSSGISMESPGDIKIKAGGDVNIEGINTNLKATAQFKAEGSSGAEMSTSAIAVVKGSLVQIN